MRGTVFRRREYGKTIAMQGFLARRRGAGGTAGGTAPGGTAGGTAPPSYELLVTIQEILINGVKNILLGWPSPGPPH